MALSVTETHELHLSGIPTLSVHNKAGNIRLHSGSDAQILVVATKRPSGFLTAASDTNLERVKIVVQQSGNRVTVQVEQDRWLLFKQLTIDLDITLPATVARIDVTLKAGNLEVAGIRGLIQAKVDAGNLDVLDNTILSDGSRLVTSAGNVTLRGSMDPAASVAAEVKAGNLRVNLPRTTAIYVDARTQSGNVKVSGWPITSTRHFAGTSATGALAQQASGTLTLRAAVGNIALSSTDEVD